MTPISAAVIEAGAKPIARQMWPNIAWEDLPPGWQKMAKASSLVFLTAALRQMDAEGVVCAVLPECPFTGDEWGSGFASAISAMRANRIGGTGDEG